VIIRARARPNVDPLVWRRVRIHLPQREGVPTRGDHTYDLSSLRNRLLYPLTPRLLTSADAALHASERCVGAELHNVGYNIVGLAAAGTSDPRFLCTKRSRVFLTGVARVGSSAGWA